MATIALRGAKSNESAIYEGTVNKLGQKHGYGKYIDPITQHQYEGEWKNDMREGQGTQTFSTGEIYLGEWKQDLFDGSGCLVYPTLADKKTGEQYVNKFVGLFQAGSRVNGTFVFKENYIFSQDWTKDVPGPTGEVKFPNGSRYVGEVGCSVNGKFTIKNYLVFRHGYGQFFSETGHIYIGLFKNDKRKGFGVSTEDQTRYWGFWKGDKKHGYGVELQEDGTYYEGDFLNGERKGRGKVCAPSGSIVIGDWTGMKVSSAVYHKGKFDDVPRPIRVIFQHDIVLVPQKHNQQLLVSSRKWEGLIEKNLDIPKDMSNIDWELLQSLLGETNTKQDGSSTTSNNTSSTKTGLESLVDLLQKFIHFFIWMYTPLSNDKKNITYHLQNAIDDILSYLHAITKRTCSLIGQNSHERAKVCVEMMEIIFPHIYPTLFQLYIVHYKKFDIQLSIKSSELRKATPEMMGIQFKWKYRTHGRKKYPTTSVAFKALPSSIAVPPAVPPTTAEKDAALTLTELLDPINNKRNALYVEDPSPIKLPNSPTSSSDQLSPRGVKSPRATSPSRERGATSPPRGERPRGISGGTTGNNHVSSEKPPTSGVAQENGSPGGSGSPPKPPAFTKPLPLPDRRMSRIIDVNRETAPPQPNTNGHVETQKSGGSGATSPTTTPSSPTTIPGPTAPPRHTSSARYSKRLPETPIRPSDSPSPVSQPPSQPASPGGSDHPPSKKPTGSGDFPVIPERLSSKDRLDRKTISLTTSPIQEKPPITSESPEPKHVGPSSPQQQSPGGGGNPIHPLFPDQVSTKVVDPTTGVITEEAPADKQPGGQGGDHLQMDPNNNTVVAVMSTEALAALPALMSSPALKKYANKGDAGKLIRRSRFAPKRGKTTIRLDEHDGPADEFTPLPYGHILRELSTLDKCTSPSTQLTCLSKIQDAIASLATNAGPVSPSDRFLILNYVLIQSNSKYLHSHYKFIQDFCKLISDDKTDIAMSELNDALSYISGLDWNIRDSQQILIPKSMILGSIVIATKKIDQLKVEAHIDEHKIKRQILLTLSSIFRKLGQQPTENIYQPFPLDNQISCLVDRYQGYFTTVIEAKGTGLKLVQTPPQVGLIPVYSIHFDVKHPLFIYLKISEAVLTWDSDL